MTAAVNTVINAANLAPTEIFLRAKIIGTTNHRIRS